MLTDIRTPPSKSTSRRLLQFRGARAPLAGERRLLEFQLDKDLQESMIDHCAFSIVLQVVVTEAGWLRY